MELIVGIVAIASGLFLAYKAGAHEQDAAKYEREKAEFARASADALALVAEAGSRGRHPSR